MTNGEHNLWLGNALKAAPGIEQQLRVANAIEIVKALGAVPVSEGGLNTEDYVKSLKYLLKNTGYSFS